MIIKSVFAQVWQRQWWCWCACVLMCLGLFQAAHANAALQAIPVLTGPVMDEAQMMSPQAKEALDQKLRAYSKETGSQVVVLTVDTTAPEDVFSYGIRVAQAWKLGRAQQEDGVLFLIAKDDRKNQIFVGRGLEGVITDVDAHRILSEVVRPKFQQDDFDQGIVDAVEKIQGLIAGEALPAPTVDDEFEETEDLWVTVLLVGFFGINFLKKLFGQLAGSMVSALLVFGLVWFLGGGLIFGLCVAVVALLAGLFIPTFSYFDGSGGGYHDGGDWGGGSDSGGGFSGGGGSFSGGGASGDW